jgi:hypothetical protein
MLPRRVYRAELRAALGFGSSWFDVLQKRGTIPNGHRDHPNGREWFTEAEAKAIIKKLNAAAGVGSRSRSPAEPREAAA